MAAWKLADDKWAAFIRELAEKERLKLAEIEFFSRPNWRGLILKASHVSLSRTLLYR
jgi:hypothetical protein